MFLVINCNRNGCLEPHWISLTLSVRLYSSSVQFHLESISLVLLRHKYGSKATGSHPLPSFRPDDYRDLRTYRHDQWSGSTSGSPHSSPHRLACSARPVLSDLRRQLPQLLESRLSSQVYPLNLLSLSSTYHLLLLSSRHLLYLCLSLSLKRLLSQVFYLNPLSLSRTCPLTPLDLSLGLRLRPRFRHTRPRLRPLNRPLSTPL